MATSIAIAPVSRPIELSGVSRKRTERKALQPALTKPQKSRIDHADRITVPPGAGQSTPPAWPGQTQYPSGLSSNRKRAGNKTASSSSGLPVPCCRSQSRPPEAGLCDFATGAETPPDHLVSAVLTCLEGIRRNKKEKGGTHQCRRQHR